MKVCTKYVSRWSVLLLALVLPLLLSAQTRVRNDDSKNKKHIRIASSKPVNTDGLRTTAYDGTHHLLGLHIDGGYSAIYGNMPTMSLSPGGYTTGFGFDYNYIGHGFIFQTGVGICWQDVRNTFANDSLITPATDSEGVDFTLRYDFANRVDRTRNLYVQLPVMAGTYIRNFYFLAGLKLNLQVAGNTQERLLVSTTATYDRYIGTWGEMDNHGIRKDVEQIRDGERLKLPIDLMATAEIGYEWSLGNYGKKSYRKAEAKDYRLRLSAFAECGLLDIMPNTKADAYKIPSATPYDFSTFEFNHILSTSDAANYHVRNLFVGVRLSFFFFGHQSTEKCLFCGPLGDEMKL